MVELLSLYLMGAAIGGYIKIYKLNKNLMAFLPERNSFEEDLASSYDLSTGVTQFVSSDIAKFTTISLHFIFSNITGSNVFTLEQSNDGTNWSELTTDYELPINTGNFILDKGRFSGKYVRVNLSSTTAGTLTIKLLAKR